ncbi:hypothetical protein GF357_04685 [Candidatus Dojkabacteria bacterium]|nr:hypothetical protein [Candidatus Dojkabacteria bacterium]
MKKYFKYFAYISFVFLAIALIRADFLRMPQVRSWGSLIIAFVLAFGGFISQGLSWGKTLELHGIKTSKKEYIASTGLSIFGKYIPGKIWIILGRAGYIAARTGASEKDLGIISLKCQFISLWIGILAGMPILFIYEQFQMWAWLGVLFWLGLTFVLFTDLFSNLVEEAFKRILKMNLDIPRLSVADTIKVLPWFLATWLLWGFGFYFFGSSLVGGSLGLFSAFGFILSATLGIVAVIAPGGLGVREGVLIPFLMLTGLSKNDAGTVAMSSRLWFLIGEALIFLTAFVINRNLKQEANADGARVE